MKFVIFDNGCSLWGMVGPWSESHLRWNVTVLLEVGLAFQIWNLSEGDVAEDMSCSDHREIQDGRRRSHGEPGKGGRGKNGFTSTQRIW